MQNISVTDWNQFWMQQGLVLFGVVIAGFFAYKTWKSTQFNNQIYTDQLLGNLKKEIREIAIKMLDIDIKNPSEKDKKVVEIYSQVKEDLLNIYELFCALYIDDAVDRKRFEKLRKQEIINLFSNDKNDKPLYPRLHEKPNRYTAIQKVYEKFIPKE